jgi:O-antigen/teichoic acid export membrane protein
MSEQIKTVPSLKSQSAWLLLAKFIGYFFAFLLPLLVVRFLSKEEVGTYRLIFQIIVNAVGILPLGFSLSVYYFLSRSREDRSRTVLNILLFNFVTGGIAFAVLFFYPEILRGLLKSDELTRLAPLAGIVIWLWIFGIFLEVVAVANQEPKIATAFIILSQFTKTFLMTWAVVIFVSVESILYAAMVQAALQIIVLLFYLNSRFPKFWTSFDLGFFKKQAAYALPFGFAGILWIMQTDIHNYFVGYRFGEAGFAIYAYGCFEFPLITMLYESVGSVMIPKMSEFQSQGRTQDIIDTTISAMNKIALAFLPIFIFLMIVSDTFIVTLFTEEYAASIPIFRINLLLLPVYIVLLDPIARAYQEVGRFLLKFRIVLLVAIIAALWFGIQYFDLTGMISIVVVSIIFERTVTFLKIRSLLGLKFNQLYLLKDIAKTAVAALAAGIILFVFYWFTRDFLLALCIGFSENVLTRIGIAKFVGFLGGSIYLGMCLMIFAPIYLLLANWFDLIHEDEKEMLKNGIGKLWIFSKTEQIQDPQSKI